jgi:Reverse transcriptase (RNA-dependent DNA polymerase)
VDCRNHYGYVCRCKYTAVQFKNGTSQEFEVKVEVHQGSELSPLLFIIVMEELASKFKHGLPMKLLYADDLV